DADALPYSVRAVIAFAIPTGDPGYNPATGVFTISPGTALPPITRPNVTIDGTTQAVNVGDTNPGQMGAGGTVGTDGLTLKKVDRPEVQLVGVNTIGVGLDVAAANVTIRGLAIYGFGVNTSSATDADIRVRA